MSAPACRVRTRAAPPAGRDWRRHGAVAGTAVCGVLLGACSDSPSTLDPSGPAASRIADLWWVMLVIAAAVVVVVIAFLVFGIARRRGRLGERVQPGDDRFGHALIALGGVAVPVVVLVGLLLFTVHTLRAIAPPDAPGDLTVEVIGHDWWWEFRYPDQQVVTANELHIPAGRPVQVQVTSQDVIHSFWVPQLHGKIDTIPGQTNTISLRADAPGRYRGQCAEYCGIQHAHMAFYVFADPPEQFAAWLEDQRRPAGAVSGSEAQGQRLFVSANCASCHTVAGTDAQGRVGPNLTHLMSRTTIAAATLDRTRANLAAWVRNPAAAKPGVNMPATSLSSQDLDALLAYLETLR